MNTARSPRPRAASQRTGAAPMRIACPPGPVLVDDPRGVVVSGCEPGSPVAVHALVETDRATLAATATFRADETGAVDTGRDASLAGTYTGTDPFGLWWSGDLVAASERGVPAPVAATLRAEAGGRFAEAAIERLWAAPGVTLTEVREPGIWGLFAQPAGGGPFPAAVAFGGSGGGLGPAAAWAPVLASHGVAVLAIAYFGVPGLPAALARIDVEVVGRAAEWLHRQPGVAPGAVAVIGQSRGSELALLAGALLDGVGPVVAFAPSGVCLAAIDAYGPVDAPAWRFRGDDLPYLRMRTSAAPASSAELMALHTDALADRDQVLAAEIPVERLGGPVLMVSGEGDAMWPATELTCIAERRAAERDFPHELTHLRYPDAGHQCGGVPGTPLAPEVRHPLTGHIYRFGGTPAANALARADSWPRVLHLLQTDSIERG
jgi:dienelactone hydrolase